MRDRPIWRWGGEEGTRGGEVEDTGIYDPDFHVEPKLKFTLPEDLSDSL